MQLRRRIFRISPFNEFYYNHNLSFNMFKNYVVIFRRINNSCKVDRIKGCISSFPNSFFLQTIIDWNGLPNDIDTVTNHEANGHLLQSYLTQHE